MVETENNKKKNGIVAVILASVFSISAIICCIYFGIMIKEHFDLQATAEGWEGLGSIGLVLVGVIFAGSSVISTLLSSLFSVITIIRSKTKIKIIAFILLGLNFIIIVINFILFIVLKQG